MLRWDRGLFLKFLLVTPWLVLPPFMGCSHSDPTRSPAVSADPASTGAAQNR
jgi:hypothetical protein